MKLYKAVIRGNHPLKLFDPSRHDTHKIEGLYLTTSLVMAWRWGEALFSFANYDIYEYDVDDIYAIFSYDGFYSIPGMARACKYKIARISEILANDLYIWGLKKGPIKTFEGEFKGIGYYPALPEIILRKNQLDHIRDYKKVDYDPIELKRSWEEKYKEYE